VETNPLIWWNRQTHGPQNSVRAGACRFDSGDQHNPWKTTMKTLLLTANYFPIRIISWERAIKMRFEQTADVLAEYTTEVSSPSVTWRVPAVLRERRVAKMKQVIRFSRVNVFLRDGYRCQYCGQKYEARGLTYDHVVPRCQGGKTEWTNIVAACHACNSKKGGLETDEAGMFPLRQPVRPKWLPTQTASIDRSSAPTEWLAFLPY
jgi:5-methylcytosine-specific restriction endonuclease McrA